MGFIYEACVFFQTCGYISEEVLELDAEEGLERLKTAINVCKAYQACFFHYKSKLKSYGTDNSPLPDWSFNDVFVFTRLETFLHRLYILQVHVYIKQGYKAANFLWY